MTLSLRDEFRLKKLGFSGVSADRFVMFQWRLPGLAYLLYRFATAIYTSIILVITTRAQLNFHGMFQPWGAYLTNWTYTVLTLYHVLHAMLAVVAFSKCSTELRPTIRRLDVDKHVGHFDEYGTGSGRDALAGYQDAQATTTGDAPSSVMIYSQQQSRWYLNIIWILLNISSTASVMVTLVFWGVLVPAGVGDLDIWSNFNQQLHSVNTILVLLELSTTAVPVRILHVLYPFCYGVIYLFFSLFYWIPDHSRVMYPVLDWGVPGKTVGFVLLVGFVVIPLIHGAIYLLYRLRLKIFACVYAQSGMFSLQLETIKVEPKSNDESVGSDEYL